MGHKWHRPRYGLGPSLEQKRDWLRRIAFRPPPPCKFREMRLARAQGSSRRACSSSCSRRSTMGAYTGPCRKITWATSTSARSRRSSDTPGDVPVRSMPGGMRRSIGACSGDFARRAVGRNGAYMRGLAGRSLCVEGHFPAWTGLLPIMRGQHAVKVEKWRHRHAKHERGR